MEPPISVLRLAYLVSQYPAVNHTFILREIRQLRRLGCEVEVASIRGPDRPPERLTPNEREEAARTYFIKPAGVLRMAMAQVWLLTRRPRRWLAGFGFALHLGGWDPRRTLFHLGYFAEAVLFGRWLDGRRLTHVHSHFSSTVALLAKRMFPITISLTIHGPDEFNNMAGFAMPEKVRDSLFLCAISDFARSQILRMCPSSEWRKIHVVRLGVDPDIYLPRPFREDSNPVELVTVGRLAPVKGHAILLEALALLRQNGGNVRLHLAGDGPERANLERAAAAHGLSEAAVFTGALTQDKVLELYRGADLFVLASFAEGIPVVLMEAMSMEIPCVATWVNGVPELIRDGVTGLLVPPANAPVLAEAIARLAGDSALQRRLAAAGRRQVVEKYDLVRNTTALRDLFARYLAGVDATLVKGAAGS
jgi:glycosyltransferase involved in cell wall biosynthesis